MKENNKTNPTPLSEDVLFIIKTYENHKYVKYVTVEGTLVYTEEFYKLMAEKMTEGNMTAVEAYESLGFDTKILSEARANCAGTRAMQKRFKIKLFEKNPAEFNSRTTFEEMVLKCTRGEMTPDELYANMAARLILLESEVDILKKKKK